MKQNRPPAENLEEEEAFLHPAENCVLEAENVGILVKKGYRKNLKVIFVITNEQIKSGDSKDLLYLQGRILSLIKLSILLMNFDVTLVKF